MTKKTKSKRLPHQGKRGKLTKVTPDKRLRFFAELANGSSIIDACKAAGVSRDAMYNLRQRHPEVKEQWEEALKVSVERLEAEAYRRAHDGYESPVYQQGQLVGYRTVYSDALLQFLLKANNRAKYGDKTHHEVAGDPQRPLRHELVALTDTQLEKMLVEGDSDGN